MSDPEIVQVAGIRLKCQHCGGERFHATEARLQRDTFIGLFLQLERFFSHATAIYVCARCGFAHFFFPSVAEEPRPTTAEPPATDPVDCLACGCSIPVGESRCSGCGWTWR